MKSNTTCPECGKALPISVERCRCGWKSPAMNLREPLADGRCEYFAAGRRCPLPGTICQYPYSKGPWHCANHWHCLDDPRLGEAVLRHNEENYEAILEERRDWREVMLKERMGLCNKNMTRKYEKEFVNDSRLSHLTDDDSKN